MQELFRNSGDDCHGTVNVWGNDDRLSVRVTVRAGTESVTGGASATIPELPEIPDGWLHAVRSDRRVQSDDPVDLTREDTVIELEHWEDQHFRPTDTEARVESVTVREATLTLKVTMPDISTF